MTTDYERGFREALLTVEKALGISIREDFSLQDRHHMVVDNIKRLHDRPRTNYHYSVLVPIDLTEEQKWSLSDIIDIDEPAVIDEVWGEILNIFKEG